MILNSFGGGGHGRLMMGSNNKQSMEYNKRMNRYYGYLGLCYLHTDDIDNALNSFKKAKNINNMDRIATNIIQNRALFDKLSVCNLHKMQCTLALIYMIHLLYI